ncbi:uncharacterized protein A4U43_C01F15760 [Asparagus officinalis]|uniref:Uncharacterized protein n=1 Tax=Asparagus officinalis TaxID=4686 RepID=A0A5P1FS57_ASPOF|nr:uncharacterized protein A4U43_C01F15760 [Asparagus officinalis]
MAHVLVQNSHLGVMDSTAIVSSEDEEGEKEDVNHPAPPVPTKEAPVREEEAPIPKEVPILGEEGSIQEEAPFQEEEASIQEDAPTQVEEALIQEEAPTQGEGR